MKLWHSFIKELQLASKSYYFYMELFIALLILFIFIFVVPEEFNTKSKEYLAFEMPEAMVEYSKSLMLEEDLDGKAEIVQLKYKDEEVDAELYEDEDKRMYVLENRDQAIWIADDKNQFGGIIKWSEEEGNTYEYYLQGYESERLRNTYLVLHNESMDVVEAIFDNQDVRPLSTDFDLLTDRQNVLPTVLFYNGALMGLFIIAAYIFLDKNEGIIKAYAVTAAHVWQYLLSKVGVMLVVTTVSTLIIVIPLMGTQPNYPLLLLLLAGTAFAASSLGLVIASFYEDLMQAFAVIFVLILACGIPAIAYFIPSWEPLWVKLLPTYPMIHGFKEVLLSNSDVSYVLMVSLGYFVGGLLIFMFANYRYKRTLRV